MGIDSVQTFVYTCDDCKTEERAERRGHLSAERPWDPYPEGWTAEHRLRPSYEKWREVVPEDYPPGPHAYYSHHRCPKCSTAC